ETEETELRETETEETELQKTETEETELRETETEETELQETEANPEETKPEKTEPDKKQEKSNGGSDAVKTGDDTRYESAVFSALFGICILVILGLTGKKKKL
ncbi:MAG: hypothetical protein PUF13_10025, partial [Lachnospiraceae bacterium]|nr:hypothetical protein [Lachnospiraceae bacterium]